MIAIIDYQAGNLTSVYRALRWLKQDCQITRDYEVLNSASHIIFPGVGAAGEAMAHLRQTGLDGVIVRLAQEGKPLLGICLGTQIIFDYSEENDTPCLGILPGEVKRFPDDMAYDGLRLKIPHMGWNSVSFRGDHPVFRGIPANAEFYFVHSFFPQPKRKENVLGTTSYGIEFSSAVGSENVVAVQFHPEKSGKPGLMLLENFCRWRGTDAE
ncbi:imidazole glycerol phosphate synthase subunit hisH [Syntrophus gentianae]|uniref:Imidazole glycerol phosphate synthase subunit HisH n=1 Tax=Syntrophus gentianae TaxID=43775 RepID=A0A1H7ZWN3_9BACT|nr:imidazole glycerol phosphate synthase subunit HisH [Syntrophus gentianae]SEM61909.1 imidazole glycerol phosphate synthase subunit hisH [Syntrophus gentianae]